MYTIMCMIFNKINKYRKCVHDLYNSNTTNHKISLKCQSITKKLCVISNP